MNKQEIMNLYSETSKKLHEQGNIVDARLLEKAIKCERILRQDFGLSDDDIKALHY